MPWVFIVFSVIYLGFLIYNDVVTYRAAAAAGNPTMINSAFGTVLTRIFPTPLELATERSAGL